MASPSASSDIATAQDEAPSAVRVATLVKGYPRLSETFIAQEILGLQTRGLRQMIVSLRAPTDKVMHDINRAIRAEVLYLPEYLRDDPARVRRGRDFAEEQPGFAAAEAAFRADLARDPSPNRHRRFGQACVLAHELPADIGWIHSHYLHTPASVARYAALIRGLGWSFSAHAKDIWTTPDWEIAEKLGSAAWGVTCTGGNLDRLRSLAPHPERVRLVYHGLDASELHTPSRSREAVNDLTIVSVGRTVEKKGYGDLLSALVRLKNDPRWTFHHVGGGPLTAKLKRRAETAGIAERIHWHGSRERRFVFDLLGRADLFVLPSRIARSGDRDGLPNVLMEAQAHGVPVIGTRVAAIPELVSDGETGLLVEPRDPKGLAAAILRLMDDPALRARLGEAGEERVRGAFSHDPGIDQVAALLRESLGAQA